MNINGIKINEMILCTKKFIKKTFLSKIKS